MSRLLNEGKLWWNIALQIIIIIIKKRARVAKEEQSAAMHCQICWLRTESPMVVSRRERIFPDTFLDDLELVDRSNRFVF